ncbi:transmembrane protein 179-like [Lineus longissimus]|uniref:transmembrane protein 179-like n=1 Tax=Lineus longissimus TaxID=88925 RepID=UPI002B4F1BFC
MGIGNIAVLAQVTALLLALIFSFFIFIPLSVNIHQFEGRCLLYATGKWVTNSTSPQFNLDVEWGLQGYCGFSIFMGVMSMLTALGYMILMSFYLIQGNDLPWLSAFIKMVVTFVLTAMMLISGSTLSTGFNQWCSVITQAPQTYSCEEADTIPLHVGENIDTGDFFVEFGMAQFGSWSSWLCWLVLFIFSLARIIKFNKQEDFLKSMSRERQRLLSSVTQNSGEYSGI